MGRKVYWSCVILVVMALRQHRTEGASIGKLVRIFGISHKTIKRWIQYFEQAFRTSHSWLRVRGLVPATVGNDRLPGDLVFHFINHSETPQTGLIACLELLAK